MDLFLFPEAACLRDGYGIAVEYAYNRLNPSSNDIVVWRSSYPKEEMLHFKENDYLVSRPNHFSVRTFRNLLFGRPFMECTLKDLSFLKRYEFNNIHCDEVYFYRAIRQLYPHKHISVRFHNCFSRILVRNSFLKRDVGWKYAINLNTVSRLEKEIFADTNVYKLFLSDEDRDFYRSIYGVESDSETWQFDPNRDRLRQSRSPLKLDNRLIWFGGVEAHKQSSIEWFINEVLPVVKLKYPKIEFHLWGRNTSLFNNPENGVFGHGFFEGEGLPSNNSLYVNPDIIGGGVKIKLMNLFENGIPFISSPFGFEGYNHDLIDGKYCNVVEESNWAETIINFLQEYSQIDLI